MWKRIPAFLIVLAAAALLSGCRNAERIAEQRVNALLPEIVGPADKYSSRVRGSLGALSEGRMDSIHSEGVNVVLAPDLVVDQLQLDLSKVSVDTKAKQLKAVESVAFSVTLREEKLNRYLRAQNPDIKDLAITLAPGKAVVRARPDVYGMAAVSLTVDGGVAPGNGGRVLNFAPDRARVAVVPVPGPVLRYIVDQINPVVDLSTMRVPVRVNQVRIEKGALVLAGDVNPADLLKAAAQSADTKQ